MAQAVLCLPSPSRCRGSIFCSPTGAAQDKQLQLSGLGVLEANALLSLQMVDEALQKVQVLFGNQKIFVPNGA